MHELHANAAIVIMRLKHRRIIVISGVPRISLLGVQRMNHNCMHTSRYPLIYPSIPLCMCVWGVRIHAWVCTHMHAEARGGQRFYSVFLN